MTLTSVFTSGSPDLFLFISPAFSVLPSSHTMTNTIKSSVNNQESANLIVHTAAATAGPTAIAGHADTATTSKSSNNRVAMEVGSASEGAVVERANSTAASSIAVTLINVPVDSTSSATPVTSTGGTTMKKARSKTASPTRQGPQQCQVIYSAFPPFCYSVVSRRNESASLVQESLFCVAIVRTSESGVNRCIV